MKFLKRLKCKWHVNLRRSDLSILWPSCVLGAKGNADIARAAFATHAFNDEAWLDHFTGEDLERFIDQLPNMSEDEMLRVSGSHFDEIPG